jgi:hypothetical protein
MSRLLNLIVATALYSAVASSIPEQIHLSFAGRNNDGYSTGYRVAWFTSDSTTNSTVQFGLKAIGKLTQSATNTAGPKQYLTDHGYHHVVEMILDQPEAEYVYRVGNEQGGWSQLFSTVAPSSDASLSFG